jgi:hypothetical protein
MNPTAHQIAEAHRIFNHAFLRTVDGWGVILSFRIVVQAGLQAAVATLSVENRRFIEEQTSKPPEESIFIGDASMPENLMELLSTSLTQTTTANAVASVDAASFVFIHSLLDAAALDYCRVAALLDISPWADLVSRRQISLAEMRDTTYDAVARAMVDRYLKQLERESVVRKIDVLYRACPPARGAASGVRGYTFDRERVERLDKRRHDIIHGSGLGKPIHDAHADLEFLLHTANHLLILVADRFGLKINPSYAKDYYARKAET